MNNKDRTPTNYAVTRKMKRFIARNFIKNNKSKYPKYCKHDYTAMMYMGKRIGSERLTSNFSKEWKKIYQEACNGG